MSAPSRTRDLAVYPTSLAAPPRIVFSFRSRTPEFHDAFKSSLVPECRNGPPVSGAGPTLECIWAAENKIGPPVGQIRRICRSISIG